MARVLPQQRLLLELLVESGDFAVPSPVGETILWRTLKECEVSGYLGLREISPDIHRVSITPAGRTKASLSSTPLGARRSE